ncbi:MAG: glycosyltransferase family 2 protein [Amylibacter sp.]|nr:glycosyltransferase family 2 protein [Amylibacter sp.]
MKNEGPYLLEWVAHHKALGFDHIVVCTNDCEDFTVEILKCLVKSSFYSRENQLRMTQGFV